MAGIEVAVWFNTKKLRIGKTFNEGDWVSFHAEFYFISFFIMFSKMERYD